MHMRNTCQKSLVLIVYIITISSTGSVLWLNIGINSAYLFKLNQTDFRHKDTHNKPRNRHINPGVACGDALRSIQAH